MKKVKPRAVPDTVSSMCRRPHSIRGTAPVKKWKLPFLPALLRACGWAGDLLCPPVRKQRDRSSSKFVLSLKSKKVMTLSAFRSMWKLVERELPETHITAHILRHTYITRLFEAGLDVKEIQYLAGHSTMDMTLSVYTHYDRKNREQQTAEKVRRAFCKEAV